MNEHYINLLSFVEPSQARRIKTLIKPNPKSSRKFYSAMSKGLKFKTENIKELPSRSHTAEGLYCALREAGASDTCYLITDDFRITEQDMDLHKALELVIGQGIGAFISCWPERLGFFESGDQGERFILMGV